MQVIDLYSLLLKMKKTMVEIGSESGSHRGAAPLPDSSKPAMSGCERLMVEPAVRLVSLPISNPHSDEKGRMVLKREAAGLWGGRVYWVGLFSKKC